MHTEFPEYHTGMQSLNRTNSAEAHVAQKLYQLNCIKKYQLLFYGYRKRSVQMCHVEKSNSSLKIHLRIHTENIYLHNMWEGV